MNVGTRSGLGDAATKIAVIGAGLAGADCAWVLAAHYGIHVVLLEMKPKKLTPAQDSPHLFAELVCSNSLKSKSRLNPAGVLKTEMEKLGSLVLRAARRTEVPAGEALAVDRVQFSSAITTALRSHPKIEVVETVVQSLADVFERYGVQHIVVATGPLTDSDLASDLGKLTGASSLYFYDAIAPIVDGETIDMTVAFKANRATRAEAFARRTGASTADGNGSDQGSSEGDYLNLPLTRDEYFAFVDRVLAGDKVPFHDFEEPRFFNGCQPIEVLAQSGPRTLAFGPMKPRGLIDPRTGREPYAAVQLRKESVGDGAFNMVGFQTRLTWPAQREVFRTLPGLQNAEFFRMGSMHRNTYLVSPTLLDSQMRLKADPRVSLAGQIMGVEGYLESAAMGLLVGHTVGQRTLGLDSWTLPPPESALGALTRYTLHSDPKSFVPMNIHWGLFDDLGEGKKLDKSLKRSKLADRAEHAFAAWLPLARIGCV